MSNMEETSVRSRAIFMVCLWCLLLFSLFTVVFFRVFVCLRMSFSFFVVDLLFLFAFVYFCVFMCVSVFAFHK